MVFTNVIFLSFVRHFLKKNRSIERWPDSSAESGSSTCRKWVSDECLPRKRTQSCSDERDPGHGQSEVTVSGKEEHPAQPYRERPERKPLLPNRELLFKKQDQSSLIKSPVGSLPSKENIQGPPTHNPNSQFEPQTDAEDGKPAIVRKTLPYSIGPKLKNALSKVFKKPPAGINGPRGTKNSGRTSSKFHWRQRRDRSLNDTRASQSKCTVKTAVSCEELDQKDPFEHVRQRRWHSTEALMTNTSRWVERRQGLSRWEEEPEDKNEATSDCESLFSLDSLSSAYATVLAEQLRQEEAAYSEAESEDSQMSKDSLTVGSIRECSATKRPCKKMVLSYCAVTGGSCLSLQNGSKEIELEWESGQKAPVSSSETCWGQQGSSKAQRPRGTVSNSSQTTLAVCEVTGGMGTVQTMSTVIPSPESKNSVKEPECFMVLTDAWSSTDAAGSPRIHRNPLSLQQQIMRKDSTGSASLSDFKGSPRSCSPTSTRSEAVDVKGQENNVENPKNTPVAFHFLDCEVVTPNADLEDVACQVEPSVRQKQNVGKAVTASMDVNIIGPVSSLTLDRTDASSELHPTENASPNKLLAAPYNAKDTISEAVMLSNAPTCMLRPSGMACSTSPTDQEMLDKMSDVNIPLFSKGKAPDVTEYKESEQHMEPARLTSRKRNKKQQDVPVSSLKMPKRSDSSESCSVPPACQDYICQDNNNNLSDLKEEESFVCVDCGSDSTRKEENCHIIDTSECRDISSPSDTAAHHKNISDGQNAALEVSGEQRSQTDKHTENQQLIQHICKSGAICSAIDLRISQMLKEHLSLSLSGNDDGKKSRSHSTNASSSSSSACGFGCDKHNKAKLRDDDGKEDPTPGQQHSQKRMISEYTPVKSEHAASSLPGTMKAGHKSDMLKSPEAAQRLDLRQNASVLMSDAAEVNHNIVTRNIQSDSSNRAGSDPSGTTASAAGGDSSSAARQCFNSDGSTVEQDGLFQEVKDYYKQKATQTCLNKQDPQIQIPPVCVDTNCSDIHQTFSTSFGDTRAECGCKPACLDAASTFEDKHCSLKLKMIQQHLQTSSQSHPCTVTSWLSNGANPREHQQSTPVEEKLPINGFVLVSDCNQKPATWKPAQKQFSCPQGHSRNSAETRVNGTKYQGECYECVSKSCKEACACHSVEENVKHEGRAYGAVRPQQKTPPGNPNNNTNEPVMSGQFPLNLSDEEQHILAVGSKKVKRLRRSQIHAHPPSSSASSLKSSDEGEEEEGVTRAQRDRLPTKCVISHSGKQQKRQFRNADNSAPVSLTPSKMKAGNNAKNSIQKRLSLPPQAVSQKAIVDKTTVCAKEVEDQHALKSQDSLMRFASSDINPFVHQWQDGATNQHCCKNQAFGSAADLTCKSPLLSSAEKRMTRCCSVDDGLNGQNSPFNSHLSTYATKRGLSSTLSSVEDCKGKTGELQRAPVDAHSLPTGGCSSSSNEIMFMYPSEQESAENNSQTKATQTERSPPGNRGNAWKGQERHRRSKTDVPARRRTQPDVGESPSWVSMESMSAHLSKLIDSTSDLLEDVQGMRLGEGIKVKARRSVSLGKVGEFQRRNGWTQTAIDVGIQTQGPSEPAEKMVATGKPKPHEISLIVKVFGSQAVSVVQDEQVPQAASAAAQTSVTTVPGKAPVQKPSADRRLKSASKQNLPNEPWPKNVAAAKNPSLSSKQQTAYTDRASSPILTVGPRTHLKLKERPLKHQERTTERAAASSDKLSSCTFSEDDPADKRHSDVSVSKSTSFSLERVSEISARYSEERSVGFGLDDRYTDAERSSVAEKEVIMCNHTAPVLTPTDMNKERGKAAHVVEYVNYCLDSCHPSPLSNGRFQEDDMCSLAPSECNTDVLVSIKPITGASPYWVHHVVPEDLPLHNKFTNWSGINHQEHQQPVKLTKVLTKDPHAYGSHADPSTQGERTKEIERLRQEREQVMATVSLGLTPTPLTMELTEAKLHYGLGETDALLKVPTPRSTEQLEAPTKQQLYER